MILRRSPSNQNSARRIRPPHRLLPFHRQLPKKQQQKDSQYSNFDEKQVQGLLRQDQKLHPDRRRTGQSDTLRRDSRVIHTHINIFICVISTQDNLFI